VPQHLTDLTQLLANAADHPALLPLSVAALLGGLVRGFTGFGFAMVFVPLASMLVGPVAAVGLIWVVDAPFALPLASRSVRRADWSEVLPLFFGALVTLPIGVWLLTHLDRLTTRWVIAIAIGASLAALVSGWRYAGRPSKMFSFGVGNLSGLSSGLASLGGMPLAIFWLGAQEKSPQRTRDNLQTYFALTTFTSGAMLAWIGVLTLERAMLGLLLCLPYGIGLLAGIKGFGLASETTFRRVAYLVIALSVIIALPLWDHLIGR
jgi:uncharacterized protein